MALNHLWQAGLSEDELAELGVQLGADVPVFVRGKAAFAEGVGSGCNGRGAGCLVPGTQAGLPCGHRRRVPGSRPAPQHPKMTLDNLLAGEWKNDCELLVKKRHPEVANALGWLLEYAPSRMTGTGACVFARLKTKWLLGRCWQRVPEGWDGFVARARTYHHSSSLCNK